jgi:Ca2+/Na+ antiporter
MVTYRSAIEKEYELAIGNIIGSNISNTFLILGLSGLIKKILFTSNIYLFSLFFLLFSSILFLVFINFKKELKYSKIVGLFIFSLYLGYVIYLFF